MHASDAAPRRQALARAPDTAEAPRTAQYAAYGNFEYRNDCIRHCCWRHLGAFEHVNSVVQASNVSCTLTIKLVPDERAAARSWHFILEGFARCIGACSMRCDMAGLRKSNRATSPAALWGCDTANTARRSAARPCSASVHHHAARPAPPAVPLPAEWRHGGLASSEEFSQRGTPLLSTAHALQY